MINLENFSPTALLLMGLLMSALAWWHVQEEQEKDFRRWQNDLLGSRNPDLPVSEWINRWVYRLGLRTILPALAFGGLFVEQFFLAMFCGFVVTDAVFHHAGSFITEAPSPGRRTAVLYYAVIPLFWNVTTTENWGTALGSCVVAGIYILAAVALWHLRTSRGLDI